MEQYRLGIENASSKTGVPESLIRAVIWQESRGNANAITTNPENGQPDGGLMQVNSRTFEGLQRQYPDLQGKNLSDPNTNILAGSYYLADNARHFNNNYEAALRAYNSGPGNVDLNNLHTGPNGTDPEYVRKVMSHKVIIERGGRLPD